MIDCNCPNGSHGQKHTTECFESQIAQLQQRLDDVYLKDRGKTNEINILTQEYQALQTELESVRAERVQLEALAAARADEIHQLNNRLTAVMLERDGLKRDVRQISMQLRNVAGWLGHGCEPSHAANELRLIADSLSTIPPGA